MEHLWAVVLAAGEGKRMQSGLPKILHHLCGKPMIEYILKSAVALTSNVFIVVGHGASQVQGTIKGRWRYVMQEQQLGTGHAVLQVLDKLPEKGNLLVLCGDTPLIETSHLEHILTEHMNNDATVATTILPDPGGYGRIIRNDSGIVEGIVEDKDATGQEKKITEINTGTYCFDIEILKHYLPLLNSDNAQNEYYLTDVISLMKRDGYRTGACIIGDSRVGLGINNRVQLAEATEVLQQRINEALMVSGVTMQDPGSVYIDTDVAIGPDTIILPNCVLESGTLVGSGCRIGPNTHLSNTEVKDYAFVQHSVLFDSVVNKGEKVVPFTYRKNNLA